MKPKEMLRQVLKDVIPLKYRIKEVPRNREAMTKELFIEIVKLLKEIDDRTNFVASEIGMDTTQYEDKFFIKCGIAGIYASKKELEDLYLVLNYYLNIEKFAECEVRVGDQDVAIQ